MESIPDNEKFSRLSYITSAELPQRIGPVSVEDIRADLSAEFSLISSSSDTSQVRKLKCLRCLDIFFFNKLSPFIDKNNQNFAEKMKSFFSMFLIWRRYIGLD